MLSHIAYNDHHGTTVDEAVCAEWAHKLAENDTYEAGVTEMAKGTDFFWLKMDPTEAPHNSINKG